VSRPYLERYPEQGGPVERVQLEKLPFTIGRSETADYRVYSGSVSKCHAAIVEVRGRHAVRDLSSTNGTFVNGKRIEEQALDEGDIIHVAHVEFCFRRDSSHDVARPEAPGSFADQTLALPPAQPNSLIRGTALLRDLIRTEAVEIVFEPIVDLRTGEVIGYEALSRGTHRELPTAPAVLLNLADQCGLAVELSQLFRRLSVLQCRRLPPGPKLFLNIHARELEDPAFAASLSAVPLPDPAERRVVMEIAESSVTNADVLAQHRTAFAARGLELAYDDFGAGYARLIELTDVPPAYLKLDRGLIDGIDAQPRQDMVSALIGVAESLEVRVIAEGIETRETAEICRRLGCGLGQGYLFCPPLKHRVGRQVKGAASRTGTHQPRGRVEHPRPH
jgi:EAL domain-containing protein (putative c-di-GMP-specific phosphodiesterase class I)